MTEDIYDTIRKNMNIGWPLQLPRHKKVIEMLKILYPSEEEVKIISSFKQPLLDIKGPTKLSKITGIPVDKVKDLCEGMAKKGVLFNVGKKFTMFPIMPGLFEFYFIARNDSEENLKKVSEIFHELIEKYGLAEEWYSSEYPFFRTLPSSSLSSKTQTLEINEAVEAQHQVLIYEDVKRYIEQASSITVVNCACRTTAAYIGNECEKPMEICMAVNMASQALRTQGLGKELTKGEALELLKKAEEHGLVHTIMNSASADQAMLICNCCSCHCGVLRGMTEYNTPRAFAKSNFRPVIDSSTCKKCEKCMKTCPMKAIWHHWPHKEDLSDNHMVIKEHSCIGCGLCAHHCPTDAIKMEKIYNDVPEANIMGVFDRIQKSKLH